MKMWSFPPPDSAAVLSDELGRKSLARYFTVMQNRGTAKFLIARKVPAEFSTGDSTEKLWQEHASLTQEFRRIEREIDDGQRDFKQIATPVKSHLDLKIEIANRILSICRFCVRGCGVNRFSGRLGYCKCGLDMTVSSIFEHTDEEPELVPSGKFSPAAVRCDASRDCNDSRWRSNLHDFSLDRAW